MEKARNFTTLLGPPFGAPTIWPSTFIGFAHPLPLRVSLPLLSRSPTVENPTLAAFDLPKCLF